MSDGAAPPEPITLDEAKLNLKLDSDAEDMRVQALIIAARQHVENYTGLVLVPRTVTETASRLGPWIDLASWPVQGVAEIRCPGTGGDLVVLPAECYLLSKTRRPARLLPSATGWRAFSPWSDHHGGERRRSTIPVEIDVVAGYPTPDEVPEAIKQAMHLLIAHYFANRAAAEVGARAVAIEIPFGVEVLLATARLEFA